METAYLWVWSGEALLDSVKSTRNIKTTPWQSYLHFLSTRSLLKHKKNGILNTNFGLVSKLQWVHTFACQNSNMLWNNPLKSFHYVWSEVKFGEDCFCLRGEDFRGKQIILFYDSIWCLALLSWLFTVAILLVMLRLTSFCHSNTPVRAVQGDKTLN